MNELWKLIDKLPNYVQFFLLMITLAWFIFFVLAVMIPLGVAVNDRIRMPPITPTQQFICEEEFRVLNKTNLTCERI